jgi:hypothetical protein
MHGETVKNNMYFILFWQQVSASWRPSGHLYKTQNKMQRSANNVFIIWKLTKIEKYV